VAGSSSGSDGVWAPHTDSDWERLARIIDQPWHCVCACVCVWD